tara:strand:- start:1 stop:138 length:138 start_codon:yes stop_codon:yes gene_type:complete
MKNIRINNVTYEMLVELGKKNKPTQLKPEAMLETLIEQTYNYRRK